MAVKSRFLAGILAAALGAHALAEVSIRPAGKTIAIGIADHRGAALGLSFVPPDEDGWTMTKKGLGATLKKHGPSEGEHRTIEAYMVNVDTPVNPISGYVEQIRKNIRAAYAGNSRFRLAKLEVAEDPRDKRCARIHLLLEDTHPYRPSGDGQRKWNEQHTLSCGSLKYRRTGFEVRYYHRYFDAARDRQFAARAARLFDSVVIEDK